eukprot:GHVH01011396.1.p1 GENE.GHVH01011396.1~~GHVH01011396.1.p1  ORF type:complete len:331 (-),score=48.74 GHVH01011396.1:485-1477(-)
MPSTIGFRYLPVKHIDLLIHQCHLFFPCLGSSCPPGLRIVPRDDDDIPILKEVVTVTEDVIVDNGPIDSSNHSDASRPPRNKSIEAFESGTSILSDEIQCSGPDLCNGELYGSRNSSIRSWADELVYKEGLSKLQGCELYSGSQISEDDAMVVASLCGNPPRCVNAEDGNLPEIQSNSTMQIINRHDGFAVKEDSPVRSSHETSEGSYETETLSLSIADDGANQLATMSPKALSLARYCGTLVSGPVHDASGAVLAGRYRIPLELATYSVMDLDKICHNVSTKSVGEEGDNARLNEYEIYDAILNLPRPVVRRSHVNHHFYHEWLMSTPY